MYNTCKIYKKSSYKITTSLHLLENKNNDIISKTPKKYNKGMIIFKCITQKDPYYNAFCCKCNEFKCNQFGQKKAELRVLFIYNDKIKIHNVYCGNCYDLYIGKYNFIIIRSIKGYKYYFNVTYIISDKYFNMFNQYDDNIKKFNQLSK
jgi:hypothetical protein